MITYNKSHASLYKNTPASECSADSNCASVNQNMSFYRCTIWWFVRYLLTLLDITSSEQYTMMIQEWGQPLVQTDCRFLPSWLECTSLTSGHRSSSWHVRILETGCDSCGEVTLQRIDFHITIRAGIMSCLYGHQRAGYWIQTITFWRSWVQITTRWDIALLRNDIHYTLCTHIFHRRSLLVPNRKCLCLLMIIDITPKHIWYQTD